MSSKYVHEPVIDSECQETIMYKEEPRGNGGFWLSWVSDGTRYYQVLGLNVRGARNYPAMFEAAKRLYRRLKKEDRLTPWQNFKRVAM